MRLKKIKILNFKNLKNISLSFEDKDVVLIEGDTGNGKSAILEAITYLLTDYLQDKISEYVRWGQDKFELNMQFNHKGVDYEYDIEAGKSTKKSLKFNGEEYLNSEATKMLGTIIDYDLTRLSAISEQGKTSELLFQKPAERLKTLKQILKIERIADIVEKIKEDIKENTGKINNLSTEITTLENIEFTEMPEFDLPDIDRLKNELELIEDIKISLEKEQEKDEVEYEKLLSEKDTVQKDINNIEKLLSQNSLLNEQKDKLSKKIESYTKEYDSIVIEDVEECKYNNNDITDCEQKESEILSSIREIDNTLKGLKDGICPTCNRPYDESLTEDDIKSKEQELLKQKDKYNIELKDVRSNKQDIKSAFDEYNKKIQDVENLTKKKNDYKRLIDEFKDELSEIVITEIDDSDIEKHQKELSIIIEKISQLKNKQYDSYNKREYEIIKNQIAVYNQKVEELEKIKKFNEDIQTKKIQNSRKIKTKLRDKEDLTRDNRVLNETKDILDKPFSSYMINKGAEYLKNKMNSFFQRAYGKYEITFEQSKSSIDFFYSDGTNKQTPTTLASGHEKAVLSVANRVALASLQGLGLLILDEIDSNAGDTSSMKLFETLLGENSISQYLIITHNEASKEYLSQQKNSIVYHIKEGELS